MAGVNVEPNFGTTVCANIRFTGCTSTGNAGNGFLIVLVPTRTATQGHITLTACTADGNTLEGVRVLESEDFQMVGGSASYNILSGLLHDRDLAKDTKLIGVTAKNNGKHGLSISTIYTDWLIDGCTFDGNGTLQTADGLNIGPSTTSTNLRLLGNYSGGNNRYGLQLGGGVTQTVLIGNSYLGNGTADRNQAALADLDLDLVGGKVVVPGVVNFTNTGFTVTTSSSDVAATTITVPPGCTRLLATGTAGAYALNPNGTGGNNGVGGDILACSIKLNGQSLGTGSWYVAGSGGQTSASASGSFQFSSLTPGATLPISAQAHSNFQSFGSSVYNNASINATLLWMP